MISLFACPKAFRGHSQVIQTNAIRSWTLLRPRCEVILVGNEEGTAEVAHALQVRHVGQMERNEYGTPLFNSIFYMAEAAASYPFMCYVNADIILMSDFMSAARTIMQSMEGRRFLLSGSRRDIELRKLVNFDEPDWEQKLRSYVGREGRLGGIDYFLFPKGLWPEIPPFAVGRFCHEDWLVYAARAAQLPVIDVTPVVVAVHQNHDYSPASGGPVPPTRALEMRHNLALLGGNSRRCTIADSTHVLTLSGLKRTSETRHFRARLYRLRAKFKSYATESDIAVLRALDKAISGLLRAARRLGWE
jgi:hypothetical protein